MTYTEPQPMRRSKREVATTVLDIVGVLLVCGGVAAIYWPLALVLAGVGALAASWKASR